MTILAWFTGSNGNTFADHERGRYCISSEPFPIGGRYYSIALTGKHLGGSNSMKLAKDMAERHAETGTIT